MGGMSGMGMLLKQLGVNPEEIRASIDSFMNGQRALLESVNANQLRVEATLVRIEAKLDAAVKIGTTTELTDASGAGLGLIVSDEKFPQAVIDAAASLNGQG